MILTVTLNLALDVTYEVPALIPYGSHRVTSVHSRGGGKGVNVARVLTALSDEVIATGLAGGPTGAAIEAELTASGVRHSFVRIEGESRRAVTVVCGEAADATVFNEPGPQVTAAEWAAFLTHFQDLAERADAVVLAGSLPPGVPPDAYAVLARAAEAPVLLDADGEALRAGLAGRPALVKVNAAELAAALGAPADTFEATLDAAVRLRTAGAGAVVVSRGANGLLAVTDKAAWTAAPPEPLRGNPTGAGDAASAALARTLLLPPPHDTTPTPRHHNTRASHVGGAAGDGGWSGGLVEAVALSAAAVVMPVAGAVDLELYARLRSRVRVTPLRIEGERR
jgi:tagatose 6-phosphate kinase